MPALPRVSGQEAARAFASVGYEVVRHVDLRRAEFVSFEDGLPAVGVGGEGLLFAETQVVKIDWLQGAQISLPMNAVNVVATYNIDAIAAPQPPADLRLSAMLGRGPTLGKSRWTDPTPFPLVALGKTPPRRIAAFASRVYAIASNPAGADLIFTRGTS